MISYRKILHILLINILSVISAAAQKALPVSQEVMDYVYQESRTPYKFGMVVAPKTNKEKYDCPTVFRQGDKWLMTFVCYNGSGGNDGRGYETWLAESTDLLHWTIKGRVLEYATDDNAWDLNQRGGFPALIDYNWGGSYEMQKHKGRNYITYIGGAGKGYEAVEKPLSIGIASTDKDISTAHPWQCDTKPLISYDDKDAQWWEYMTQYKSTIYKMDKKWFGAPYVMFYNAGGKDDTHPKGERIGVATSKNMKDWKRFEGNPIFAHDSDGTITGDAQIVWMPVPSNISDNSITKVSENKTGIWVMYYFSAFNPTREYNAYNTFAVSSDLKNWTDWNGADLIIPSKPYDEMFAHKSYVVKHDGVVYHFYCAVNNSGQRGIAVATSKPCGKSEISFPDPDPTGKRTTISLNKDWDITVPAVSPSVSHVNIPINLDDYYGTHQGEHGNLHGEAIFTKHFTLSLNKQSNTSGNKYSTENNRFFLRFEGVGTYADVTLNGKNLGHYDIGRTVENIDATEAINPDGNNELIVKVSHPSNITDIPWVCGGCSSEWGFSEGSQPFGIYRPVTLEITDNVRIEPFGTHIWSNEQMDSVFVDTEVKNYSNKAVTFQLISKISEKSGKQFARLTDDVTLQAGESKTFRQKGAISKPTLWTQEKPYLYTLLSMIKRNGKATDDYPIKFGFRSSRWPSLYYANYVDTAAVHEAIPSSNKASVHNASVPNSNQFFLNDSPVYINGICEYEHLYGQSHAFQNEQIEARIKEVKDLGFNAFRDAHQPHNLRYGDIIQEKGILWWPQFSAHIWYDTPQFRESFKRHLVKWVKERRNNPAVVLWGLQNESTLPKDFAEECCNIIRELDPTCGRDRLITTCNGGEGSDWNVVQNWSGTYGGNVYNYGNELKRPDQLLNGEYGAWRTLGNHSGVNYSEEKQADLLETKCQQAESVRDSICGQFLWLLNTHDNPGRRQPDEAYRRVDKVGPYNYKGLVSPWEQPVSSYYMYKSRYTPVEKEPVCFIVRDIYNGIKSTNGTIDSLRIYSNCEEVSLLINGEEKARMQKPVNSTLFVFKNIKVPSGASVIKAIATGVYDEVAVNNYSLDLPLSQVKSNTCAVNCGGDAIGYFEQDPTSLFPASQHFDATSLLPEPYKSARFGRHNIDFTFKVKKGETYEVKLHFVEPWYGASRSEQTDYEGFRIFDVAFNNTTILNDLDIWAQAGYNKPYIRSINYTADADTLLIHFPEVKVGQAIISAIEITPLSPSVSKPEMKTAKSESFATKRSETFWQDLNHDLIAQMPDSLLPAKAESALQVDPQIIKDKKGKIKSINFTYSVGVAKIYALRFRYWNGEEARTLHITVKDKNGVTYVDSDVAFLQSQMKKSKRKMSSITTGSQTNAGTYIVTVTGEGLDKMEFDKLTID